MSRLDLIIRALGLPVIRAEREPLLPCRGSDRESTILQWFESMTGWVSLPRLKGLSYKPYTAANILLTNRLRGIYIYVFRIHLHMVKMHPSYCTDDGLVC